MKLRYTLPALAELTTLLEYLHATSPQRARRFQVRVRETTDQLLVFPYIGRRTNNPLIRRIAVTSFPYLIFYQVTDDEIVVHAVKHAARRPSDMPGAK